MSVQTTPGRAPDRGTDPPPSSRLLAAAPETAWFNALAAVPNPGYKLTKLIEAGLDIAEVIRLTEISARRYFVESRGDFSESGLAHSVEAPSTRARRSVGRPWVRSATSSR